MPLPASPDNNNNVEAEAFDSHVHLDRTGKKVMSVQNYNTLSKCPDQLVERVLNNPKMTAPFSPVKLVGMVAVYCDPETYPEYFPSNPRLKFTVGFHPRKSASFSEQVLGRIQKLLLHPIVVGLGEIGLDWTEPQAAWEQEEEVF